MDHSLKFSPGDLFLVLKKTCILFFIPFIELIALRIYLHHFLKLRIGFIGMTDFDFLLPLPIASFFLVYAWEGGKKGSLPFREKKNFSNLFFVFCFLLLNHSYAEILNFSPFFLKLVWHGLLLAVFLSALCIFLPFSYYNQQSKRWMWVPFVLIASVFPLSMNFFSFLWPAFSFFTYQCVKFFVGLFFGQSVAISLSPSNYLVMEHAFLKVRIGQGCIGLDGIFLFTFVCLLFFCLRRKAFSGLQWGMIYLLGILGMCLMNIFRILFLFSTGISLYRNLGSEAGRVIFTTLAHTHVGWILYLSALVTYFSVLFAKPERKKNFQSEESQENLQINNAVSID